MFIELTFAIFYFLHSMPKQSLAMTIATIPINVLMICTFVILFFLRGQPFVKDLKQEEIYELVTIGFNTDSLWNCLHFYISLVNKFNWRQLFLISMSSERFLCFCYRNIGRFKKGIGKSTLTR